MTLVIHADSAVIADLRAQVRRAEAERDEVRAALTAAVETCLDEDTERKSRRFFFCAWKNANRRYADAMLRICKLEKWLKESGAEATRLQVELQAARDEVGVLTRQLAASEEALAALAAIEDTRYDEAYRNREDG